MPWNVTPSAEEAALLIEAGTIYRDAGRRQEAREVFQGVRALFPASDAAEVALGTVAFLEKDIDGAVAHYRKALEINPRSALALAHLGQASVFQKDKEAANRYCTRALELDPRGACGKFARAVMEYAEAVEYK